MPCTAEARRSYYCYSFLYHAKRPPWAYYLGLSRLTWLVGESLKIGYVIETKHSYAGTNNPYEGVFICADGDPLNGSHWIMFYWVSVCSIESCLLGLALYKAWEHRHRTQGGGLMRALTRDSVLYFIMWVSGLFLYWIAYYANMTRGLVE